MNGPKISILAEDGKLLFMVGSQKRELLCDRADLDIGAATDQESIWALGWGGRVIRGNDSY